MSEQQRKAIATLIEKRQASGGLSTWPEATAAKANNNARDYSQGVPAGTPMVETDFGDVIPAQGYDWEQEWLDQQQKKIESAQQTQNEVMEYWHGKPKQRKLTDAEQMDFAQNLIQSPYSSAKQWGMQLQQQQSSREQRENDLVQQWAEQNPEEAENAVRNYQAEQTLNHYIRKWAGNETPENLRAVTEVLSTPAGQRVLNNLLGGKEQVAKERARLEAEYAERLPGWNAMTVQSQLEDYRKNPMSYALKNVNPSESLMTEYIPEEKRNYDLAMRMMDGAQYKAETISALEQAIADARGTSSGKTAAGRFLHGLQPETLKNALTMGFGESEDLLSIARIAEKASRGETLTDGEQAAAGAYIMNLDATQRLADMGGATTAERVGNFIGDNAPFLLEMAATGGLGAPAAAAARGLIRRGIARGMKNAAQKGIRGAVGKTLRNRVGRYVAKQGGNLVGAMAEGAVTSPLSTVTANEYANRTVDQYDVWMNMDGSIEAERTRPTSELERMYKSLATGAAERTSEAWGRYAGMGHLFPRFMRGTRIAKFTEPLRRLMQTPSAQRLDRYVGNVLQWNGQPMELMEEQLSNVLQPLLTGELERIRENFSSEAQMETLLGVVAMGGVFQTMSTGAAAYDHVQSRRRSVGLLGHIQNPDLRQQVSRAMGRFTQKEQAKAISNIDWDNASLHDMAAATDYIMHRTQGRASQEIMNAMQEQTEAHAALQRFNKLKNQDTGRLEEVFDTQGRRYFLSGGALEKGDSGAGATAPTADGTLFVIDAETGEVSQKSIDELKRGQTTSYEEFEAGTLEAIRTVSAAQSEMETLQDIAEEAEATGDNPALRVADYMGIDLSTLTGKTVTLRDGSMAYVGNVSIPQNGTPDIDVVPLDPVTGMTQTGANGEEIHRPLDITEVAAVEGIPVGPETADAQTIQSEENGTTSQVPELQEGPQVTLEDRTPAGTQNTVMENADTNEAAAVSSESVKQTSTPAQAASEIAPVGKGPFGNIYLQFRGKPKEAIEFLLKQQEGEAVGALSHPQIGEIDLVWGKTGTAHSDGYGLAKIAKYHPEVLENLQGIISGMTIKKVSGNRIQLESMEHLASIRLDWDGNKKTWLLTAFEKETPTPLDRTTDVGENLDDLQNDTAPLQSGGVSKKSEYSRHTTTNQTAESDEASQTATHSGAIAASRMNAPTTNKDTNSAPSNQEIPRQKDGTPAGTQNAGMENADTGSVGQVSVENPGMNPELDNATTSGVHNVSDPRIGRSLTSQEADELLREMQDGAQPAPEIELNAASWSASFDENNSIQTPIGRVKMGDNQMSKFFAKGREKEFGMVAPTLSNPDVIVEKNAPESNAERDTKYLFIKTFIKSDGSRFVYFESITVQKAGLEISVSSHEADENIIKREMQNGKVLHLDSRLSSGSEGYLTRTPTGEGQDLVPTSDNPKALHKDTNSAPSNQGIPRKKDGTPDYAAMEPGAMFQAIAEDFGEDVAREEVARQIEIYEAKIKKLAASRSEDINVRLKNRNQIQSLQAQAEALREAAGIADNSVIGQTQQTAAPTVKPTTLRDKSRALGDYLSVEDKILRDIAEGLKFRWSDNGAQRGLGTELGFSDSPAERKARFNILSNDGITVDQYAERLEHDMDSGLIPLAMDGDMRSAILDILTHVRSNREAYETAVALRENDPRTSMTEEEARQQTAYEASRRGILTEAAAEQQQSSMVSGEPFTPVDDVPFYRSEAETAVASQDFSPEHRQTVEELVEELNRGAGADAVVFSTIDELPDDLQAAIRRDPEYGEFVIEGVSWGGHAYICAPAITNLDHVETVYHHEVAGHCALFQAIPERYDRIALFQAVVDGIGLEHMQSQGIPELNEEIDAYQKGEITKARLGEEYVAYSTERLFSPALYNNTTAPVFSVDLSEPVTDATVKQIVESANRQNDGQPKITIRNDIGRIQQDGRGTRMDVPSQVYRGRKGQRGQIDLQSTDHRSPGELQTETGKSGVTSGRGVEASQAEHRGAISGQDNAGADSNQPRALPAGETVTQDDLPPEISSVSRYDVPFLHSEAEEEAIQLDLSPEHRQAVEEMVTGLNQELGENVVVFSEWDELPEKIREEVRKAMEDGYVVYGLTFQDACYLYSPAITDEQTAHYVYTHELAGHKNVEAVFPDRISFVTFCNRLVDDIGVSEMAESISDAGFMNCVNDYFTNPDAVNKYVLGREYIAYLTENSNVRDLYAADYEGKFSLPSLQEFITTDTLLDLIHYANSRQGRSFSQGQGRMGRTTETEADYRRTNGTTGMGASNTDRLSGGGQTADRGRSRPDGVSGSGTDYALSGASDNLSGRTSPDAGGTRYGRSTQTSSSEYQGTISGQDNAGVDSNQPGTLPAGETVTGTAESEISSSTRFRRESSAAAYEAEIQSIIDQAKANGTYLKAPNGKPTRLSERQWAQVRTRAFKRWFGDWEKAARLRLIDALNPISVDGNPSIEQREAEAVFSNLENGKNRYDGREVVWVKNSVGKIMRHKGFDTSRLIPAIKDVFDASVPILSEAEERKPGHKEHSNFKGYHHYVGKISLDGRDYYVRFALQEINTRKKNIVPNQLHSAFVSDVEIMSAGNRVNTGNSPATAETSTPVDVKLQNFIESSRTAVENSSKVVDENGEPLVVFHGSSRFNPFEEASGKGVFKPGNDGGIHFGTQEQAEIRGGEGNAHAYFLNIRNPKRTVDRDRHNLQIKEAKKEGYDGTWYNNVFEAPGRSYVAFYPNQIKSATDNTGEFSADNDDIRFRRAEAAALSPEEVNERFNDELKQQIDGTLPEGHVYRLGMPSEALRSAGVPELPMELSSTRLAEKASADYKSGHPFSLEDMRNLPQALQNPIAVFDSKTRPGSKVILTELTDSQGNNFVAVTRSDIRRVAGRRVIQVNSIRSIYPKDYAQDVVNWINRGDLLKWADKEKTLDWLGKQQSNSADVAIPIQGLDVAANILENFENPTWVDKEKALDRLRISALLAEAQNNQGQTSGKAALQSYQEHSSITKILETFENPTRVDGEKVAAAEEMAAELGVPVRIVRDRSEIGNTESLARDKRGAEGWHERATGEIAVVLPNCRDAAEVQKTILHEAVGHYGIPELLGRERADEFYRRVFRSLDKTTQARLLAKHGSETVAGDEYLAEMAEGNVTPSIWKRIMAAVRRFFRDVLGINLKVTDAEMRYILWRSKHNLQRARTVGEAMDTISEDIRMRVQTEREAARERKAQQLEKLRKSEPIQITGEEITPSENLKQYKKNALEYGKTLRGEYVNLDSGERISLFAGGKNGGIKEVLQHDYKNPEHLQAVAAIPQIIENSILIDSEQNQDRRVNPNVKQYAYYVVGLKIGDTDYTVKAVVAQDDNGNRYYDHKLTQIEKGTLIDGLYRLSNSVAENQDSQMGFSASSGLSSMVGAGEAEPNIRRPETGNRLQSISPIPDIKDKRLPSILQPALTEIEKGDLIVQRDLVKAQVYDDKAANAVTGTPVSTVKDKRLLQILQPEPLKYQAESTQNEQQKPQMPMQYVDRVAEEMAALEEKEIRFRRKEPNPNDPQLTAKRNFGSAAARRLQDDTLPVRQLQDYVRKHDGQTGIDTDAHSAMNRATGIATAKMQRYNETIFRRMDRAIDVLRGERGKRFMPEVTRTVNAIRRAMGSKAEMREALTVEQIDAYVAAKASIERHASGVTAYSENPLDPWNRERVFQIVRDFEDEFSTEAVEELWESIRAISHEQRRVAMESGLISAQQYREMGNRGWKYYVPLQGIDAEFEGITSPEELFGKVISADPSIRRGVHNLFRRAMGRTTKAENVLATLRANLMATVITGERNKARLFLLRLVEQNPELQGDTRAALGEKQQSDVDRAAELETVNNVFNQRLQSLTEENADKTVLWLGTPSPALQSAGVGDRPMKLHGNKVLKKMKKHGFNLEELKDLPRAVADPIAVFNNKGRDGNRSILTELRTDNGNFLVTIDTGSGPDANLNVVYSVFGNADGSVINWFNKGYATYINKKKALAFLYNHSAPIAGNAANEGPETGGRLHPSAPIAETSDTGAVASATNIIKNFENPSLPEQKHRKRGIFEIQEEWYVRRDPERMTEEEREAGLWYDRVRQAPSREEIEASNAARAEHARIVKELEQAERDCDREAAKGNKKDPDKFETLLDRRRELSEAAQAAFERITAVRTLPRGARYAGESKMADRAHEVVVFRHGARTVIRLSDPLVAQAVNHAGQELIEGALANAVEWTRRWTRRIGALSTQWNPAFFIPNNIRDLVWAGIYSAVDSEGNFRGFVRNVHHSYAAIARAGVEHAHPLTLNERAEANIYSPEGFVQAVERFGYSRVMDSLYDDFRMEGGLTGYSYMQEPRDIAAKMKRDTNRMGTVRESMAHGLAQGFQLIGDLTEVSTRFATFLSQVQAGRDVREAVNYARNITVNFNTRGEWGRGLNSLFMFFNASVQGVANLYKLVKRNPRAGTVMILTAGAMGYMATLMLDWALEALSDGDDSEGTWSVSEYERYTNLIIPGRLVGLDDKYFKIPVPMELRPFWIAGVLIRDVTAGRKGADEAMKEFGSALAQAFSPLEINPNEPMRAVTPTIVEPIVEINVWNTGFTGRKINRVPFPGEVVPDASLGSRNAHFIARWVSRNLNELAGGNENTPAGYYLDDTGNLRRNWMLSLLDISPSTLEHVWTSYTGGLGRELTRTVQWIAGPSEQREIRDMPVINRFFGEMQQGSDEISMYYDLRDQIDTRLKLLKKNFKDGELPPYYDTPETVQEDMAWLNYIGPRFKKFDKEIKETINKAYAYDEGSEERFRLLNEASRMRAACVRYYDDELRQWTQSRDE